MQDTHDQPPKRLPNSPTSPGDAAESVDAIAAEVALLQQHDEQEERKLIRFFGTLEPCQLSRLLRLKSKFRARYNLTERVGLLLAIWHYRQHRSRYLHGQALVEYQEQRERGRTGSLRAKLMSCRDEIAALHTSGMSYPAICRVLKQRHEKLFRGLHIDPRYLGRIMRTSATGGDGKQKNSRR